MTWDVLRYDTVDSTNNVCKALAAQGLDSTAVIARRRPPVRAAGPFVPITGGRPVSFRPGGRDCPAGQLLTVTPLAAVAVCRAVESLCDTDCGIKWCNDVVLHGKKLCGILTESSLLPDGSAAWLVVGIGVNVGQASFPPDIADMATSLALQELDVSPDALADAILAQLTALRTVLTDPAEWLAEYRRRCVNLGRPVRVLRGNTVRQATALAIDEQFGLTVQYENGETETVRSGEVSVRGLYGYIE